MTQEIIARLKIISADRTPEMITEAIGVECDRSWHVGDARKDTTIIEKNNGWILHSGLSKNASLQEHIEAIWRMLRPAAARIRQLSTMDTVELSCVVYSSSIPALSFDNQTIERLAELGAGLDIDLYVT